MHPALWVTFGVVPKRSNGAGVCCRIAIAAFLISLGAPLDAQEPQDSALEEDRRPEAPSIPGGADLADPEFDLADESPEEVRRQVEVEERLESARAAFDAGLIDQPEHGSAWFFYRRAMDLDPNNPEAIAGLRAVQSALIDRALTEARNGDFDFAEQLLDEAMAVRDETDLVDAARSRLDELKHEWARTLESRAVQAMDDGDFEAAESVLIDLVALGGQRERIERLRHRVEELRLYGGFTPGQVIRDRFLHGEIWAPETVVIEAGSFTMGSPATEAGRLENEGPAHRVTFRRGFALGLREVTVQEFGAFVRQSDYRTEAERRGRSTVYDQLSGRLTEKKGVTWEANYEGRPAEPADPVVHVSWNDAQAFADWLARGTGKPYRVPSEAEFEYALRAGTTTRYWWGDRSPARVVENLAGSGDSSRARRSWSVAFEGYTDRHWGPAPVASFEPNPFGLYDMGGNVGEWVRDCWHDTYFRAPGDGSAWINPGCTERVVRGGYWASSPDQTRSAHRLFAKADFHDARIGFRIARDL